LSGSISSLPFMVFKRSPDGVHTEAREHPAYKLLSGKPDGYNTSSVFMGEIAWHLGFARNAFCRVLPGTDSAI
uniref:phage portal protein n=1 Tax=Escherichia coli TaxID=562 RepID=UPI0013D4F112